MGMLPDSFEVVIGVDTHQDTHTAAVLQAATGAVIDDVTVATDPAGLTRLASRWWASSTARRRNSGG